MFCAGDDGSTVTIRSGDRRTVILESNPTTGCGWQLAEISDPGVLEKVGEDRWTAPECSFALDLGGGIHVHPNRE